MDKVNKLGSAVSKKLVNRKTNKNNQSGGDSLEQIVRSATAKELKAPDAILNQKVSCSGLASQGGGNSRPSLMKLCDV